MPRGLGRLAAALMAGTAGLLAPAIMAPARAAVPVLVIAGRGYGHGVGLAQDGAYWMGRAGARVNQILGQFYPGTGWGRASGAVRVVVQVPTSDDTVIAFPGGGEVNDGPDRPSQPGFPVHVAPGGSAHVWFDGARYDVQVLASGQAAAGGAPRAQSYAAGPAVGLSSAAGTERHGAAATNVSTPTPTLPPPSLPAPAPPSELPSTTTTTAAGPWTSSPPGAPPASGSPGSAPPPPSTGPAPLAPPIDSASPLWMLPAAGATAEVAPTGRRYRGVLQFTAANGPLRVVNQLDVEDYLRGMGEVLDAQWPAASLQAQAVASRTYALRAMQSGGELCDDDHCQVYLGQQVEYAAMDRAVAATRGLVLVYDHALADTVFSANGGAVSATPLEGFGPAAPSSLPYLRSAPYPTQDPSPWTVTIGMGDLAARFSYPGSLSAAAVTGTGPSGRALAITLDGSRGRLSIDPHQFAAGLGLRSTLFTLSVASSDVAPAPPAPADLIQVPADEAARSMGLSGSTEAAPTPVPVAAPVRSLAASPRAGRTRSSVPAGAAALLLAAVVGAAVLNWRRA